MARILVVDDEPDILEVMRDWLALRRYGVLTAADGAETVRLAAVERPDLILLDADMPGVGGVETCRTLRTTDQTRHIPVILITGPDSTAGRIDALVAGADDYVTRPVALENLGVRMQALLAGEIPPAARGAHLPGEAAQATLSILSCDLAWLFAADSERQMLVGEGSATRWNPATAPGLQAAAGEMAIPLQSSAGRLAGSAINGMAEFNLPLFDLAGDPERVLKTCQDLDLTYVSLLPLRSGGDVLGVLLLGSRAALDVQSQQGRQRMAAVIGQASAALENARLTRLLTQASAVPHPLAITPAGPVYEQRAPAVEPPTIAPQPPVVSPFETRVVEVEHVPAAPPPEETVEVPAEVVRRPRPITISQLLDAPIGEARPDTAPAAETGRPPTAAELLELIRDIAYPDIPAVEETAPATTEHAEVPAAREDVQAMQRIVEQKATLPEKAEAARIPAERQDVQAIRRIIEHMESAPIQRSMASLETVVRAALDAAQPLARQAGVELVSSFEEFLPDIYMDRERIRRATGKLLESAIRLSPPGGYVRLIVRDNGQSLKVEIAHQGVDAPPEGYKQVEQVILQHEGRFWVEVEAGKGSLLAFTLPRAEVTGMGDFIPEFDE